MKILTCVALLLIMSGCSTVQHKSSQQWIDLFTPDNGAKIAKDCLGYGMDRIESDQLRLTVLKRELDSLNHEMTRMRGRLSAEPDLIEKENEEVALLLLRFINARDSLHDILHYYHSCKGDNTAAHIRGALLGMNAGLSLAYYDSRLVALFIGQKEIVKLLNAQHPDYEIARGTFDKIQKSITANGRRDQLELSWRLFLQDLNKPDGDVAQLQKSDADAAAMIKEMYGLQADAHIQIDYILYARRHGVTDLGNEWYHSRLEALAAEIEDAVGKEMYKAQGVLFKDVARIKTRDFHLARFSDAQVQEIKSLLQPGDVVLTYTAGYMSDVFLPGSFKHGITYIGRVDERRKAGLTDDALKRAAVSEHQGGELVERVQMEKTPNGDEINVIEAVSEGVMMHSLDHLLATHINRMLVLRPRITSEERLEQLIRVFQYVGGGYDFKFDFTDDSYQCCTELVYRTLNGKGSIDFSLSEMKGRWILDADGIATYALSGNPEAFDLVLLVDTASPEEDYRAIVYTGDEGMKKLSALLTPEK